MSQLRFRPATRNEQAQYLAEVSARSGTNRGKSGDDLVNYWSSKLQTPGFEATKQYELEKKARERAVAQLVTQSQPSTFSQLNHLGRQAKNTVQSPLQTLASTPTRAGFSTDSYDQNQVKALNRKAQQEKDQQEFERSVMNAAAEQLRQSTRTTKGFKEATDGLARARDTYSALDAARIRREQEEPEKMTFGKWLGNVTKGAGKQSVSSYSSALSNLYELGSKGRQQRNQEGLEEAQYRLESAQRTYQSMLDENKERPGKYSLDEFQAQRSVIITYQKQVDAFKQAADVDRQAGVKAHEFESALAQSGARDVERAAKGQPFGKAGEVITQGTASALQSLADAAAGGALVSGAGLAGSAGRALGMAPFGVRAYGGGVQEAYNEMEGQKATAQEQAQRVLQTTEPNLAKPGYLEALQGVTKSGEGLGWDPTKGAAYGATEAGIELATEMMWTAFTPFAGFFGGSGVEEATQNAIGKAARKLAKTATGQSILSGILNLGATGAGEGLEEFVGDWARYALNNKALYGGKRDSLEETLSNSLYEFAIGAASGMMMGAPAQVMTTAADSLRNRVNPAQNAEPLTRQQEQEPVQPAPARDVQDLTAEDVQDFLRDNQPQQQVQPEQVEQPQQQEAPRTAFQQAAEEARSAPDHLISEETANRIAADPEALAETDQALRQRGIQLNIELAPQEYRGAILRSAISDMVSAEEESITTEETAEQAPQQAAPRSILREAVDEAKASGDFTVSTETLSRVMQDPQAVSELESSVQQYDPEFSLQAVPEEYRATTIQGIIYDLAAQESAPSLMDQYAQEPTASEDLTAAAAETAQAQQERQEQQAAQERARQQELQWQRQAEQRASLPTAVIEYDINRAKRMGSRLGIDGGRQFSRVYQDILASQMGPQEAYETFAPIYNASLRGSDVRSRYNAPQVLLDSAYNAGQNDARRVGEAALWGRDHVTETGLKRDRYYRKANVDSRTTRMLDGVSRAIGVRIAFTDQIRDTKTGAAVDADGMYDSANHTIWISTRTQDPLRTTFTHEVVHSLRAASPEAYNTLSSFVQGNTSFRQIAEQHAQRYGGSMDLLSEESVADAFGYMLSDSRALQQFADQHRTAAQRLADTIHDIAVKIRRALSRDRTARQLSPEQRAMYQKLAGNVEEMESLLTDAIKQTAQRREEAAALQEQRNAAADQAKQERIEDEQTRAEREKAEGRSTTEAARPETAAQEQATEDDGYAPGTEAERMEFSDVEVKYSIREEPPPTNTRLGYKVFFLQNGQLYPPMAPNPGGLGTETGIWLNADEGKRAPDSKTGRPQLKAGGKGTSTKSQALAWRPGWHLGSIPIARQFNRKNPETGQFELVPGQFVFCLCEYAADVNYQEEAMSYGYTKNGKFQHSLAGLPHLPKDGYYLYRTNPNPKTDPWAITGAMRVLKAMTDEETDAILRANGIEPLAREGGPLTPERYAEMGLEQLQFVDDATFTSAIRAADNFPEMKIDERGLALTEETRAEEQAQTEEGNSSTQQTPAERSNDEARLSRRRTPGNGSSRREETTEDHLRRENERLKEQVKQWQNELKVTPGRKAKWQKAMTSVAKQLIQDTQSTYKPAEITADLQELGEHLLKYGKDSEAQEMADRLALSMAESAQAIKNEAVISQLDGFRERLRKVRFTVPEEIKGEFDEVGGYNEFRRRNMGRMNLVKNGNMSIDTFYNEQMQSFPGMFSGATNEAEQLMNMAEVLDATKPVYDNPNRGMMREATEYISTQIIDALTATEGLTPPTFADLQQEQREREVQQVRDEAAAAAEAQKLQSDTTIANLQADLDRERRWRERDRSDYRKAQETAQHVQELLEQERAARVEEIEKVKAQLKEQYEQRRQRERQRAQESKDRDRLLKIARRLKNAKLPKMNRDLINQYIGDLDTISQRMTLTTVKKLSDLRDWYADRAANDPDFVRDPLIERKLARLSQRHIGDMTQQEVADLTDVLLNIENEIRTERRLLDKEEARQTYLLGTESIRNIQESSGSKGGPVDRLFVSQILSPTREMHRLTGYNDDDPIYRRTIALADGQRKALDYQMRAERPFNRFAENRKFSDMFSGEKAKEIEITGWTKDGEKTVKITPAMRTALYLHSLAPQNLQHIVNGGITVPDMKLYKKGKIAEAYARGETIKLTASQIRTIVSGMTATEKEFAEETRRYFNATSKEAINATSETLKGYSLADVEEYFPINTDTNFTRSEFESIKQDGTIEGMGFLKERVNARNPILLRDVNAVLEQSIQMNGKYVGLAIPVRDFNKVYNVSTTTKLPNGEKSMYESSVKQAINKKWGKTGADYVEKMMKDIQNGHSPQNEWAKVLNKLKSNYAGAVLTLNLSVAMKQAASYPTAAAVLGWSPLLKAMGKVGKVDLGLIEKYTPLQWYRSKGYSTKELGDMASANKHLPVLLNWIQAVDVITTRKLWKASEYYVKSHNKDLTPGSDAFYRSVADIYNRVIEETQPNYTTMQRPQLLRSDDTLLGNLQMFKTQPFQNTNILYDAGANLIAKTRRMKNNTNEESREKLKAELKAARRDWSRAVTSQAAQLAVFAGMTMAWAMFRGKPEKYEDEEKDEMTLESVLSAIGKDMAGGLLSGIPFGSDAWEVASSQLFGDTYYGMEATTVQAVSDTIEAATEFPAVLQDIIDRTKAGEPINWAAHRDTIIRTAETVSKSVGIPVENVLNLFRACMTHITKKAEGDVLGQYDYLKLTADPVKNKGDYYALLYKALENGDTGTYSRMAEELITQTAGLGDDAIDGQQIESAMASRYKKALAANAEYTLPEESMALANIRQTYGEPETEEQENSFGPDDLSPEQFTAYSNDRARYYSKLEDAITGARGFDRLPDKAKNNLLSTAASLANAKALDENSDGEYKMDDKWMYWATGGSAYGVSESEALLFRAAFNMAESDKDKNGKTVKDSKKKNTIEQAKKLMPGLSRQEIAYLSAIYWTPEDAKLKKLKENDFVGARP